jgi:hypothetical protein
MPFGFKHSQGRDTFRLPGNAGVYPDLKLLRTS